MMNIKKLNGQVRKFSEFCFQNYSVKELKSKLVRPSNFGDCRDWDITPEDSKVAVEIALIDKQATERGC